MSIKVTEVYSLIFLYLNLFDGKKLIEIIFDLPIDLNKLTIFAKETFINFISKPINSNFIYFINLLVKNIMILISHDLTTRTLHKNQCFSFSIILVSVIMRT